MANNEEPKPETLSRVYKTKKFTWGYGNKEWAAVKIHPESGCKMTDTNILHEDNNPCIKEYYLSMNCMSENALQRDICVPYFDNYRICKIFWRKVIRDRRSRGIMPAVPSISDRDEVKNEYLGKKGFEL